MEDLGQIIFTLGVPVQRLELGLQEIGGERMTAYSLKQSLDIRSAILLVVAHPGHACLEDFRLAAHIKLIAANEGDELAVGQVEKLLLGRHLGKGEGTDIFIMQSSDDEVETKSRHMYWHS